MNPCFADTYYFLALLNPRDHAHQKVVQFSASFNRRIITTGWVLTELADGLAQTTARQLFPSFLQRLRADSRATILPCDDAMFDQGVALYSDRPDKHWSLTDCLSFSVMKNLRLSESLTADHHFEQAGFITLLK